MFKSFRPRQLFLALVSLLCLSGILLPATAAAASWDPFGGVNCSGNAANSVACQEKGNTVNPLTGSDGLVMKITNVIAFVAGVAAVVIIVISGFRIVTSSGGDSVASARRAIIYSLVGIVVVILARTIVAFILGKL